MSENFYEIVQDIDGERIEQQVQREHDYAEGMNTLLRFGLVGFAFASLGVVVSLVNPAENTSEQWVGMSMSCMGATVVCGAATQAVIEFIQYRKQGN